MLGEKIGVEQGRTVVNRVLPSEGGPKLETSFQGGGTLLGVPNKDFGTYWAVVRPDGTLYGEGQGVVMGANGAVATWKGQGVGLLGAGGAASWRGAIYYTTQSEAWLALNKVAAIFHWEVDGEGNTRGEFFEWK